MAAAPVELSRREREAVEAQRKKDHYMKLHAEGKTEEAQVTRLSSRPCGLRMVCTEGRKGGGLCYFSP